MMTSRRGFASMTPEKRRAISSLGGKAAHEKGTAHQFTTSEAIAAGRKGGETVSQDRAHMAAIGRKGGRAMHYAELPEDFEIVDATGSSKSKRESEDV
jgi:general stress protein YciG